MSTTPSHKYSNRLITEKSPYLLQHAHNPVDWYPWSEEAFDEATRQNRPVFLSIGYSTCHWCHVMEKESFEDESIAEVINAYFIPIKVDREERPDIDGVYMSAVMRLTGQGGWPLTVILTPDKKPFFGGTYFPPFAKWGSAGLVDILKTVSERWQSDRDELIASSQNISTALAQSNEAKFKPNDVPDDKLLDEAVFQYKNNFDEKYAGFGQEPKFPSSHNLSFLLRYWYRTQDNDVLRMVEATLEKMAQGGIYDHIGGGFHRYATDRYWQIPHFEKMLYDQAMLVQTYTQAYQVTKDEVYKNVVIQTCDYVLERMTDKNGGFYSAEDADSLDSNGQMTEGAYYVWDEVEIKNILNADEFTVFSSYYSIRSGGNAHTDPHQEFVGKNIIFTTQDSVADVADKLNLSEQDCADRLCVCREKILKHRMQRPAPHLDDKILTDWNGLMISALALAGKVFHNDQYSAAARVAADFIFSTMVIDGKLYHRYRDQDVAVEGHLDDYAFLINACLDLFETGGESVYYEKAIELGEQMMKYFWDDENKGFFFTSSQAEELIFRAKDVYDGAVPSGNAMAAQAMIRLAHMTLDKKYDVCLENMFMVFSNTIQQYPTGYAQMLSVFDCVLGPNVQIILRGSLENGFIMQAWQQIYNAYIPNKIVVLLNDEGVAKKAFPQVSYIDTVKKNNSEGIIYLCENNRCRLPVTDIEAFEKILKPLIRG